MPVFYLESSALMKRYRLEAGTDLLYELFSGKTDDETFVASRLSLLEASTVMARHLKGRQMRPVRYQRMVDRIGKDFRDHIFTMPVDNALVEEAQQLLPEFPLRAADALHFATARRVATLVRGQPYFVLSADKELSDACGAYSLDVLNPLDADALERLRGIR